MKTVTKTGVVVY